MKTINERFRYLRECTGLSQEAFAQKARRTRSEIKNIEYGKTQPKEEVIQSICEAHNVNEVWLRTGAGDMYRLSCQENELAATLKKAQSGQNDDKSRLIRAIAQMPDEEISAFIKIIENLCKSSCE